MKFILTETQWILEDLDPIEWTFLDRIPEMAGGESLPHEMRQRLLPDPLDVPAGERERYEGFLEDWNEFVRPDLETAFAESRDQVSRDLAMASVLAPPPEADPDAPSDEDVAFEDEFVARRDNAPKRVEVAHEASDAWYSALNQARMLMNESHDLAETMANFKWPEEGSEPPFDGTRVLLMAQYEFYTALQSILIEVMNRSLDLPPEEEAEGDQGSPDDQDDETP